MLKDKIRALQSLSRIVARIKKAGKRVVFTNGCFDILHYGHAKYLEDAKALGDILIVAVNSDSSVRRIKVAALESVDYCLVFNEDTPLKTIKRLKPDILVKGADWKAADIVGGKFVESYAGQVKTIKLIKGRSTTSLIKKIAKKNRP
jgi:rfaE bifunctional protein nucleotidyltransferase chain/domain